MTTETDDLNLNEEENEEEDDPFSMAMKELSETNRQADEIARVRISFFNYREYTLIKLILATFNTITTLDTDYASTSSSSS